MKAKKSLGQHWLRSRVARNKIIEAAKLTSADTVLEIGPGEGFLTEELLGHAGRVIAVEKDDQLINLLREKFSAEITTKKLELIHADILDFKLTANTYKLVANLPYYITGQILRQFLTAANQPKRAVLLIQKEVAERIIAQSFGRRKKESVLSISVKAFGDPKIIKTVPAGAFAPAPKVDSAILLIENISRERLAHLDTLRPSGRKVSKWEAEKMFFGLVRRGFAGKRKQLKNNLSAPFDRCRIKPTARAEELTLADWLCLCTNCNEI